MERAEAALPEPPGARRRESWVRWASLIGVGVFATTLPQIDVEALKLPLQRLLKDDLHVSPSAMAAFFAAGALAWYMKPLAGVLADNVPLFGSRRRHYLILSGIGASALWLLAGLIPRSYSRLLLAVVALNATLVVGSTVVGGLLVEVGQRLGVAGRLVSVSNFVQSGCALVAGPLGGLLARQPFEIAAGFGSLVSIAAVPIAWLWLREPAAPPREGSAWREVKRELGLLAGSRGLWFAAALLFVASIPHGSRNTALFFHQRDVLRFPVHWIGSLDVVTGASGLVAAAVYGVTCRRLLPRTWLWVGLTCAFVDAFVFVFYRSLPAAVLVQAADGVLATLTVVVLMDLAVRATPAGGAAAGFAVLMSVMNGADSVGDVIGAALFARCSLSFFSLAAISAAVAALVVCAVPFVPRGLLLQSADGHADGSIE
jgi:MFS family permease